MPEQFQPVQSPRAAPGRWRRFTAALPMRTALAGVTAVWLLGCVWSFEEQTHFAEAKGFTIPWLLPLVIDGLAAAMAGVAYAAGLDARPAIPARIATALAVAASATSNAAWAWERSGADQGTVALAIGIPVAANLAFEVLLSELRRQVQRRRGQAPPVAVPYPRVIRFVLAPFSTFVVWRRLVLELTDPRGPGLHGPGSQSSGFGSDELESEPTAQPAAAQPVPAGAQPAGAQPAGAQPVPAQSAGAQSSGGRSAGAQSSGAPSTGAEPAAASVGWPTTTSPTPVPSAPAPTPSMLPTSVAPAPISPSALPTVLRPEPGPRPVPVSVTNGARSQRVERPRANDHRQDDRVRRIADLLERGEDLTGESVGEMLGCSARTGRRLLRQGSDLAERRSARRTPESMVAQG